jgi:hypothetical protein
MRDCSGRTLLLALILAVGPPDVRGQTPEARGQTPEARTPEARTPEVQTPETMQLPALFVTRLQGASAQLPPAAQRAPQPSADLPPLPATTVDARPPGANLDGPRRISLTISRPMPLGDLLLLLVNGTPFSLVDGGAVTGATFVGDLKDLTMRQAIEAVLFARELDYDVQGTLIRVFPRKTSTRLFNVNYPNTRRSLTREVAGSSSSTTQTDFFDDLEKGVQSLLSTSGRMHVDRTAGIVQVTDYADRLDQVGVYVEAVQLRAGRQVRIDAQVFEVALPEGGASSIDWRTPAIRSATGVRSTPTTAPAPVATTDIGALIKAIAQQGVITPMASPQVLAMNNEPAIVRFGDDPASADSSGRRGQGLTLTVVAQISADRIVQMHVSPSYSSRTGASLSAAIRVNEADTVVRVLDGETVVLSGFLIESAAAVGHTTPSTRSELVILLTPTIVRSAALPH